MITAQDVKRLRDLTGAGMMDSKRALTEADGDFDAAIDILRKKGQKVSTKRADREAKEGVVALALSEDSKTAALVEVNCETDFVARNDEFVAFAQGVADLALARETPNAEALKALPFKDDRTVGDSITDLMGKIGEKIDVRRVALVSSPAGQVVGYIHPGAQLGVLVELNGNGTLAEAGRDVAMQVAAMNPVAARVEEVPAEVSNKELQIGREAAIAENKPEHIIDRIAEGKLKRFYKDNVLVEQPFVKDSSMTVGQMLQQANAEIVRYVRFALGD